MNGILLLAAALFAVLGVALVVAGGRRIARRQIAGGALETMSGLVLVCLGALSLTIAVATQGYRALTREEVAVVVETRPITSQEFEAVFRFPEGEVKTFRLAGDQLYVDAHILKWKPWANLLGLHTDYELDRVTGRYISLEDERAKPRTVFSLAQEKPLDMFELRRRFPLFRPLVDAEYGSATFISADQPARFEILVSTSGLLVRQRAEP
jgi:hypothetical protein